MQLRYAVSFSNEGGDRCRGHTMTSSENDVSIKKRTVIGTLSSVFQIPENEAPIPIGSESCLAEDVNLSHLMVSEQAVVHDVLRK